MIHRLAKWAKEDPNALAQTYFSKGELKSYSIKKVRDRIFYLALFLESKGFAEDDVLAIFSINTPEWVQCDLAPHLLGGMSAGIYPNSSRKDIQYILDFTEARFLAVLNADFYRKATGINNEDPLSSKVELILVFDGDTSISPLAVSIEQAIAEGKKLAKGKTLEQYLEKMNPQKGAFLIFTSGTTGHPKGAILSHENMAFTSDAAIKHWGIPFNKGRMFSFLPLCHVAEKIQNVGVGITCRYDVAYASKIENVAKELPIVLPTVLLSVPRLWEKMMETAESKIKNMPLVRRKMIQWAFDLSEKVFEARLRGEFPKLVDFAQLQIAERLVLSKVKQTMGLSKISKAASGAAALSPHVSKWFRKIGIEILEDYGQTESTGVVCMTVPNTECAGTVGIPLVGTELKLAEDGEILSKGKHIFVGYLKNDSAMRDTVKEGWLHTGDLGEYTDKGLIRIRGRKKEIMKTSGGKMVAPLPIEEKLKEASLISQACMVGDGRKYLSVLITLPEEWNEKIKSNSVAVSGMIVTEKGLLSQIQKVVDDVNAQLASYERIKQFRVLAHDFSVEGGEMTPTLKVKRSVVEKKYDSVIEDMYLLSSEG